MTQTITIIVSPTGQTNVETQGYSGPACQSASKFLEEALGHSTAEQLTSPYFVTDPNHHQSHYQMEARQ